MKYQIIIPSYSRAKLLPSHPLLDRAWVAIDERQLDDYEIEFAKARRRPRAIVVHRAVGVSATLNVLLDKRTDEDFLFIFGDDLNGVMYTMTHAMRIRRDPEYICAIIEHGGQMALDAGAGMFGFAATPRPHERSTIDPLKMRTWVGGACGIVDRRIRFDEALVVAEDIDASFQSVALTHLCIRDERWGFIHDRWTAGGLSGRRTTENIAASYARLRRKWGDDAFYQPTDAYHGRKTGQGVTVRMNLPLNA